jgi:hypothetical protein
MSPDAESGYDTRVVDIVGYTQWLKPRIQIMLEGSVGTADYGCRQVLGPRYFRLAPILTGGHVIDDEAVERVPEPIALGREADLDLLIGEDLAGSAFIIRLDGIQWAVMSQHQFGGKAPSTLMQVSREPESVALDKSRVAKQRDVQAMPLKEQSLTLQYLGYDPTFTLGPAEELLILGPAGDVVAGTLRGMVGQYSCANGVRTLEARTTKPFLAAGGSGGPVIKKSTAMVVGVLMTANDGEAATVVGFETLCLEAAKSR